jgi:hypothetical protein
MVELAQYFMAGYILGRQILGSRGMSRKGSPNGNGDFTPDSATTPLAGAPGSGTNTAYSQTNSQNTVGTQASGCVVIAALAGVSNAITYSFGYSSSGSTSMQYVIHVSLEALY